ncbi:MAG: 8-oxoguanine DNA glycosylase [Candidatus Kapaibacteriales bacterium]
MMKTNVDEIFSLYEKFKDTILIRLHEFASVPINEYFWELCFCLLTPSTRADNAIKVVNILREKNFFAKKFDPTSVLRNSNHYVRFHNVKAKRLLKAVEQWDLISPLLVDKNNSPQFLRKKLVEMVDGLGMKEASHFLRNIGFKGLAVLDRHILKNLNDYRVIVYRRNNISSMKRYLEIEAKFQSFANFLGIGMEELDLLFWAKETGYVLK